MRILDIHPITVTACSPAIRQTFHSFSSNLLENGYRLLKYRPSLLARAAILLVLSTVIGAIAFFCLKILNKKKQLPEPPLLLPLTRPTLKKISKFQAQLNIRKKFLNPCEPKVTYTTVVIIPNKIVNLPKAPDTPPKLAVESRKYHWEEELEKEKPLPQYVFISRYVSGGRHYLDLREIF